MVGDKDDPDVVFLTVYVDDMLLLGEDEFILPIKEQLFERFKIKDLGNLRYLLGIEMDYIPGEWLTFSQTNFTNDNIKKFGYPNMHSAPTPQVVTEEPPGRTEVDELTE